MEVKTVQLWAVDATHEAPALFVKVCRLDEFQQQGIQPEEIAGVSLIPQDEITGHPTLSHAPIHEHALALSNASLIAENVEWDEYFDEGYMTWLEAYREGRAGAFAHSPSQVYHMVTSVTQDG